MTDGILGASFRDPSGFVYVRDGSLYRQVNRVYAAEYDQLMDSGLYEELVEDGLLISHSEVESAGDERAYRTEHGTLASRHCY